VEGEGALEPSRASLNVASLSTLLETGPSDWPLPLAADPKSRGAICRFDTPYRPARETLSGSVTPDTSPGLEKAQQRQSHSPVRSLVAALPDPNPITCVPHMSRLRLEHTLAAGYFFEPVSRISFLVPRACPSITFHIFRDDDTVPALSSVFLLGYSEQYIDQAVLYGCEQATMAESALQAERTRAREV
jgi:hypothetical protein